MNAICRTITVTVGAGILSAIFVSSAVAGCGDLASLQRPFEFAKPGVELRLQTAAVEEDSPEEHGGLGMSIVGLWKVQFISIGNTAHNPSLPDSALIDFGYSQWHSDGTEILNSGGHSPASGNWCLGVWVQTAPLKFQLNHFPIAYDPVTGIIANYINIREQITLSARGDSYTGTFTLDVFDPKGNQVDHLGGTILATRLTVDSTIPGAIPSK